MYSLYNIEDTTEEVKILGFCVFIANLMNFNQYRIILL